MTEPEHVRRFLITSTREGFHVGIVRVGDDPFDISVEFVPKGKGGEELATAVRTVLDAYEPAEVLVLLPLGARIRDSRVDTVMLALLWRTDWPRLNVIASWAEFQRLERDLDSDDQANRNCFARTGDMLIHRLHLLQRAAARADVVLGEDRSLTYGTLLARYETAVEAAASEQQKRIAAEMELREAQRIISNFEVMVDSLKAALSEQALH